MSCQMTTILVSPQCVNGKIALVQIKAWRWEGAKPFSEPFYHMVYYQLIGPGRCGNNLKYNF